MALLSLEAKRNQEIPGSWCCVCLCVCLSLCLSVSLCVCLCVLALRCGRRTSVTIFAPERI